jgi:hypothetical protein
MCLALQSLSDLSGGLHILREMTRRLRGGGKRAAHGVQANPAARGIQERDRVKTNSVFQFPLTYLLDPCFLQNFQRQIDSPQFHK